MKKITAHSNFLGLIVIVSAVLCLSPLTSAALQGDLNGDNAVNGVDLGLFADQWLNSCSSPSWCSGADINQNGIVEGTDYSVQANNWLKSTVPGPISLWRLDETSGTSAYDSTGNGHNGTCSATDWSPAGGKYNGAALFDATTDFISVPTTGMNYNAVSISLWVNPTADTDNAWFFGHTSNPTDIATNRLQIKTSPGTPGVNPLRIATPNSAHLISGLPLMTPSTWFHIVLTLSGTSGAGTAICYVNGAQAGTGAYSGFTALAATAHIGNDDMGAPTHGAKAYIDDVAIWNSVLSASNVAYIYANGIPAPPGPASNPTPADGATGVASAQDLSWTAGASATCHDVFFGTANPPPQVSTCQTATTYDPGNMKGIVTYYWRINGKNSLGSNTGPVWSFTTVSTVIGQATNPFPANGATGVAVEADGNDLSWTAASGAVSHNVYLGTVNPPPFIGNQTTAAYDPPGLMSGNTTHYWKINEVNVFNQETVGTVWSFKTSDVVSPPATNPNPAIGAVNVDLNADISWTKGSIATSHDVYFGTVNPPTSAEFKGNQTAVTYDPGLMAGSKVHYWRIDEVGPTGIKTTGSVWSFTTVCDVPPGAPTNTSPANGATGVSITPTISWSAGTCTVSYDVYFGTAATPPFIKNQTTLSYSPGSPVMLSYSTVYRWQIVSKNSSGQTAGAVWSFTTMPPPAPPQAYNPSPTSGAAGAPAAATLTWTSGTAPITTSQDVYFGTANPPPFIANQTAASYSPGVLDWTTQYYWRINTKGPGGTTAGSLWSFTTESVPVYDPVAYWKFDETSGTVADDSAGSNDGQIRNGVTLGVPGVWDTAFSFDGDNDEVFVADNSAIEFQDSNFTVAFWMKSTMLPATMDTLPYEPRILCKGSDNMQDSSEPPQDPGTGKRYQFYLNRRYQLFRFCIDDNTDPIYGKSQVETAWELVCSGNWVHIAGVRDVATNELRIFMDGDKVNTALDQSGSIDSGAENLIIANGPWTGVVGSPSDPPNTSKYGFGFVGELDDIMIFNKALPDDQVGRLPSHRRRAWHPNPLKGAINTGPDVTLTWMPGDEATAHDVYFGTNPIPDDDVNAAAYFIDTRTVCSYDPGPLDVPKLYHWRIDEHNPTAGIVKGQPWFFNTGSGPCDMRIPCDESSLRAAFNVVQSCAEGGTITFDCSFTTIFISDRIDFSGNYMTLDGEDRKLTFRYNGPDGCNQSEGQDHFIKLSGNNNTIRNFKMLYFPNGIPVEGGADNIIENLSFPTICEDAVTNSASKVPGIRTIIRNCYFVGSEDKSIQMNDAVGASCMVENCHFINCSKPTKLIGGQDGLYVIRNCLMETSASLPGSSHGMLGPLFKPDSGGGLPNILFENNILINSKNGIGIDGTSASLHGVVRNNILKSVPAKGENGLALLYVAGTAEVKAYNNEIIDGGKYGVKLDGNNAKLDLGGGALGWTMSSLYTFPSGSAPDVASSPGLNILKNNKYSNAVNMRTDYTVSAMNNCWDVSPPTTGTKADTDIDYWGLFTVAPDTCTGAGPSATYGTPGLTGPVGPE